MADPKSLMHHCHGKFVHFSFRLLHLYYFLYFNYRYTIIIYNYFHVRCSNYENLDLLHHQLKYYTWYFHFKSYAHFWLNGHLSFQRLYSLNFGWCDRYIHNYWWPIHTLYLLVCQKHNLLKADFNFVMKFLN